MHDLIWGGCTANVYWLLWNAGISETAQQRITITPYEEDVRDNMTGIMTYYLSENVYQLRR